MGRWSTQYPSHLSVPHSAPPQVHTQRLQGICLPWAGLLHLIKGLLLLNLAFMAPRTLSLPLEANTEGVKVARNVKCRSHILPLPSLSRAPGTSGRGRGRELVTGQSSCQFLPPGPKAPYKELIQLNLQGLCRQTPSQTVLYSLS